MKTIRTFNIELWTEPEEKERAREQGLDTTQGVFEALKAHLEENGLLPDKSFEPWDKEPAPLCPTSTMSGAMWTSASRTVFA